MATIRAVLGELFPDGVPMRATDRGLWLATPVAVLATAFDAITSRGRLGAGRPSRLLDAGAGDGRVLGVFGSRWADRPGLELLGIEDDASLFACAQRNLQALRAAGRLTGPLAVARGDYLAAPVYTELGVAPTDIDLVVNYPDGNENALEHWLASQAGERTRLLLLGPDRSLSFAVLDLDWAVTLEPPGQTAWRLIVSRPIGARQLRAGD